MSDFDLISTRDSHVTRVSLCAAARLVRAGRKTRGGANRHE